MIRVQDLMTRDLITVEHKTAVSTAAKLMRTLEIGSLVVEKNGEIVGIVTESDIVRKVVSMHRMPEYTPVECIMSSPVISIQEDEPVFEAAAMMEKAKTRHLAVANHQGIRGILSVRDLLHPVAIDEL